MKWIRWQGFVPFVAITALLAAFWLLLADSLAERIVEKTGTALVGAKVELDGADLTLFPLGLELGRLQVTNPDEPMVNAVEVARIAFGMDALQILRRKVLIEEMAVEGMRFGTERASSGAIAKREKAGHRVQQYAKEKAAELQIPDFGELDAKKIIEQENLESLKLVEEVKARVEEGRKNWKKRLDELPSEETFQQYRARVEKIQQGGGGVTGALQTAGEVKKIKDDIDRDLQKIKDAKSNFEKDLAALREQIERAKKAPFDDLERLKNKYGLSPQGMANLSKHFLGPTIAGWVRQGLLWYERIRPSLERKSKGDGKAQVSKPLRAKGREVRFPEREPLPDFLIRSAGVGLILGVGDLSGKVEHITPDQDIYGKPLIATFEGTKLKGVERIALTAGFNHIRPDQASDKVALTVSGYRVQRVVLSENEQWPITLAGGRGNLTLEARIAGLGSDQEHNSLEASVEGSLSGAQIKTAFVRQDAIGKALAQTIEGVKNFRLKARIKGSLEEFDIDLESDLDRILSEAVANLIRTQAAELSKKLEAEIMKRVGAPLGELTGSLASFGDVGGDLTSRLQAGALPLPSPAGGATKKLPFKVPF